MSSFDAAPAKVCTAWRVEKSCCKTILGVRVCACFTMTCVKPSARVAGLAAPLAGNAGGCAAGNRVYRWPCVITAYTPGKVSGTCNAGLWFRDVPTARLFVLDEPVFVRGCVGMQWRLFSASNAPLRISR